MLNTCTRSKIILTTKQVHINEKEFVMKNISSKKSDFNDFRFEGLNWKQYSNNYLTMNRVSHEETKIIVKVVDSHLKETKYGYALILDRTHVVFLKNWQVSSNYYGNEVLLQKDFFQVKEWGDFDEFDNEPENLIFENWLEVAKEQEAYVDEDGTKLNRVRWEI